MLIEPVLAGFIIIGGNHQNAMYPAFFGFFTQLYSGCSIVCAGTGPYFCPVSYPLLNQGE
jgi:hypothetical protein